MSFKKTMIVYRKELMEVLRDRRTLFTTFLLPVILYPVLIIGFNAIMSRQMGVLEQTEATIAVRDSVNNPVSQRILQDIGSIENYDFIPAADNAQELYLAKDIQSIITIRDSLNASGLRTYHVYVQYDAADELSTMLYSKMRDALIQTEKGLIEDELQISGINPELLNLIDVRKRDTADSQIRMLIRRLTPWQLLELKTSERENCVASDAARTSGPTAATGYAASAIPITRNRLPKQSFPLKVCRF